MAQRQEPVEPVEPIRWYQALYTALAHPSVSQYQTLAANPNAKLRTAIAWVGIASVLAVMGLLLVTGRIGFRWYGTPVSRSDWEFLLKWAFEIGIVVALANLFAFWLFVAIQHQLLQHLSPTLNLFETHGNVQHDYQSGPSNVTDAVGGLNSTFGQLAYVQAASFAPTLFIAITLSTYRQAVLLVSVIAFGIYALIAAKAIYKRGWGRSISSVFLALVIPEIFLFVVGFGLLFLFTRSGSC
jgi:hypothetical protein